MRSLDQPRSDLFGEQPQPLTDASPCWVR
jgi:hypothetical protein